MGECSWHEDNETWLAQVFCIFLLLFLVGVRGLVFFTFCLRLFLDSLVVWWFLKEGKLIQIERFLAHFFYQIYQLWSFL